jgi:hypothetical protein
MAVLRWLFRLVLIVVLAVGAAMIAARVHDGPLGPLPGGKLVAGTLVTEPVADWSFAADVQEIELQLESQSTSRTTWILVQDGKAYVPASTKYPPGKTWHRVALTDGRAILRIDGKKYPVTLTKVEDPAVLDAVRAVAAKKYRPPPGGAADVWLFSVTPRPG